MWYFCVSRHLVGCVKSKKYHVAVFVLWLLLQTWFFANREFRTSGAHMFVCWRAAEHSLELWHSPSPGVSFSCAPEGSWYLTQSWDVVVGWQETVKTFGCAFPSWEGHFSSVNDDISHTEQLKALVADHCGCRGRTLRYLEPIRGKVNSVLSWPRQSNVTQLS